MLEMPKRSVTRFFIPMIDVLTLLFATFLLLPVLKATAEVETQRRETPVQGEETAQELQKRLVVRVLEIEAKDKGRLKYHDPNSLSSVPVLDEQIAKRLINNDQQKLKAHEELYYLILVPRDDTESPHPLRSEKEEYDTWFRDVAHGFEDRSSGLVTGRVQGGTR